MLIPYGSFGGLAMTYLRSLLSTPFGSTSSPSWDNFGLQKMAQDNAGDFDNEVIDAVLKNFYVNDCLKSMQSNEVASKVREDLCVPLTRGGFRLVKWLCNRMDVLKTIPTSDRASSILDLNFNSGVLPIEITLGVQCNIDSDMFTFKMVLSLLAYLGY